MLILNTCQNRMKCKEFHHWLSSRDIREAVLPGEVRNHMAGCSECQGLFRQDGYLEEALQKGMEMADLPAGLMDQITLSLDHQTGTESSGRSKMAEAAGAALACLIIIMVAALYPFSAGPDHRFRDLNQIGFQAVEGHLAGNRHMSFTAQEVPGALDVLTKALGFQVLLPDFDSLDCTLLGGRLCALGDCRAAYFVLEKDGRTGSLFIMDTQFLDFDMADGSRFNTRLKGCEARVWKDNGQLYAMVF